MESAIQKFLNTIHIEESEQEKYKDINLKKVTVSNKKNSIDIYLSTDIMLKPKDYEDFKKKIEEYFNTKVYIYIENTGDKSLYLEEYFKLFVPEFVGYLKDRLKINGSNNNYIVAYNHGEVKQIEEYLKEINFNLTKLGYEPLTIYEDDDSRDSVVKMINDSVSDIETPKEVEFPNNEQGKKYTPRRKKIVTADDPRAYYGDVIEDNGISLKDIVLENENIVVECEVFSVAVFESSMLRFS